MGTVDADRNPLEKPSSVNTTKEKVNTILEMIVLIAVVFGSIYFLKSSELFNTEKPDTGLEKAIMWVGIFVMMFVVLGVHELGHLLTGLVQGFQFQLFVVGPLGIKREDGQIKTYFNKNLGMYGGVAATTPTRDDPQNAQKFARLILAGPLTSLVFSILCLSISTFVPSPYSIILFAGGSISLAIFFATTIPTKTGMFFTDRKRFQRLITPGQGQEVEMAMLRIMGRYAQDNSYRAIAKDDILTLTRDDTPFMQFYGYFNLLCYQMEMEGQTDPATEQHYRNLAADLPKSMVQAMDKALEKIRVTASTT